MLHKNAFVGVIGAVVAVAALQKRENAEVMPSPRVSNFADSRPGLVLFRNNY
jgi:hypothetical protein